MLEENNITVVKTKKELKQAIKRKDPYIEIKGDLAKKLSWMGRLSSKQVIALLGLLGAGAATTVTVPVVTPALAATAAAITGQEVALIIFVLSMGIAIVIGVIRDYDIEAKAGDLSVKLTRKSI